MTFLWLFFYDAIISSYWLILFRFLLFIGCDDGLVQDCSNSIANAWSHCSLALSHWFVPISFRVIPLAVSAQVPVKQPKRIWVKPVDLNKKQTPQYANLKILRPIQNGGNFADGHFKCICLNENVWISIKISLNFVPKIQINNIPALVQIIFWHRPGHRPLSGPMMFYLTDVNMHHSASTS